METGGDTEDYLPDPILQATSVDHGKLVTTHHYGSTCSGSYTNKRTQITWVCDNATEFEVVDVEGIAKGSCTVEMVIESKYACPTWNGAVTDEPTEDPTFSPTDSPLPAQTLTDEDCNGLYDFKDYTGAFLPRDDSYTFDVRALLSLSLYTDS